MFGRIYAPGRWVLRTQEENPLLVEGGRGLGLFAFCCRDSCLGGRIGGIAEAIGPVAITIGGVAGTTSRGTRARLAGVHTRIAITGGAPGIPMLPDAKWEAPEGNR